MKKLNDYKSRKKTGNTHRASQPTLFSPLDFLDLDMIYKSVNEELGYTRL